MYDIDLGRYSFSKNCDNPSWLMDERHVRIIHNIIMENDFKTVAEIGCYTGYSTIAIVEAINKGKDFTAHLIDWNITKQLSTLLSMCAHPSKIKFHQEISQQILPSLKKIDLIIIDGDHTINGAGYDLFFALENEIPNIVAHDTNAQPNCRGSELIGMVYKNHKDFMCLEDKLFRENENTERGLLFATSSINSYERAKKIYCELSR